MNKLQQLIQQYCPDGVEYIPIGNLIKRIRERGKNHTDINQVYAVSNLKGLVKSEDFRENAIHSEDISNYTVIKPDMFAYNPSRLNIGSIAMLKDENAGLVSPMYVVFSIDKSIVVKEYFEYFLHSSYVKNKINSLKEEGARFRFDFERWNLIYIPIPPLSIQTEIVRILDKFSTLTAELQAELQARKSQYEYYRNQLLDYPPTDNSVSQQRGKVEWKTLGEIALKISSGGTPNTTNSKYYNGNIPWLRTQEVGSGEIWDTGVKITELGLTNSSAKIIPANCVIVAMYGATVGKVGINKIPLCTNQACANIQINENIANYRYVYYCLLNQYEYIKSLGAGSQTNINAQIVKKLLIPIPPLSEQARIVSILDKFDALVNSISEGLPKEIELRQKQYEYYRNMLLTFPSKNA